MGIVETIDMLCKKKGVGSAKGRQGSNPCFSAKKPENIEFFGLLLYRIIDGSAFAEMSKNE